MPELPDITVYIEALQKRIQDQPLLHVRIAHPFLLRTADPLVSSVENKRVLSLRRIGKRIAIGLEQDLWIVLHLMIAGRLHWKEPGALLRKKTDLAAFDFPSGSLILTEAGTRKQTSLHVLQGEESLRSLDPGGTDVLEASFDLFASALTQSNHTVKRALTDPHIVSGIGNAYSDEILFEAKLSPATLTQKLSQDQISRLYDAARKVLSEWTAKLREEAGEDFPEKVTAFRKDMAVHGRYGLPCIVCGSPIQRIRHATNESNYCAQCQTGGRLLADRALSRLLKKDRPRTIGEMEKRLKGLGS